MLTHTGPGDERGIFKHLFCSWRKDATLLLQKVRTKKRANIQYMSQCVAKYESKCVCACRDREQACTQTERVRVQRQRFNSGCCNGRSLTTPTTEEEVLIKR